MGAGVVAVPLLAEVLEDLAGAALGKLLNEFHRLGDLVGAESLAALLDDPL
jgi:hypothetical protein